MMKRRHPMRLLLREHGICGGTETVNIHLIKEFTELVERVVWIVPPGRMDFFQQILPASDRLVYQVPYSSREAPIAHLVRKATSFALRRKSLPARSTFENLRQALFDLWLKRLVRNHQITHCFCNWTFGVEVPRLNVPIGAMLMDVRWKRFPETFPYININAADRQFGDWLAKSSVVFPVSETTASDIRRFYPWHAGRTRVVPHGAHSNGHDPRVSTRETKVRNSRCVFFCPAAANGHKNHLTLFKACAELFSKHFDFDIVLTGLRTEDFGSDPVNGRCRFDGEAGVEHARAFLHDHEQLFRGRIKPLGYVERARVDALFSECSAVVLPSLFEGFGLPLIEALQNGAVVICSDIPAHREQLTRYGCLDQVALVQPTDAVALAAEMERVLIGSAQTRAEKHLPPNALKKWTWRDVAEAYLESLAAVSPN